MSVNQVDKLNKWTALLYAASEGHAKTVKALIQANAHINFLDEDGNSSLYYAVWEGHTECAQELVDAMVAKGQKIDPSVSMALGTATATSSPNLHDPVDLVDAMDISSEDLDGIPDLALPPPILPLRKYGHNFLDKKIFVQLFLDIDSNPIQFDKGDAAFPAGRLTMASRNNKDIIPRSINLPLSDNDRKVSFQVESLDDFAIDFEIYPTYGTRIIAKSTALPYVFNTTNTTETPVLATIQTVTLPLFDMRLQTIGKIKLRFQIVRPFAGQPLEITKFDTYWKSTSQIEQQQQQQQQQQLAENGQSQVQLLLHSEELSLLNVASHAHHHGLSQALSLVTASSLSGEYCRIMVCMTKDLVPVVASSWQVEIQYGVKVPVGNLDLETLLVISSANSPGNTLESRLAQLRTARDHKSIREIIGRNGILPLTDFLRTVQVDIKFDVCVLYPTIAEISSLNIGISTFVELNKYVDTILTVLFDHVREIRASKDPESAPFGGSPNQTRSLIFSSTHPDVCTVLNWKQPNYPVFFDLNSVTLEEFQFCVKDRSDRRCTSLKEATLFAASNNLLGVIGNANLLALIPSLVGYLRASGLVLVADTSNGSSPVSSVLPGVDGVRDSQSLIFKSTIDM